MCFFFLFVTENKNWIHPPETLQKGHIAYLVKVSREELAFSVECQGLG